MILSVLIEKHGPVLHAFLHDIVVYDNSAVTSGRCCNAGKLQSGQCRPGITVAGLGDLGENGIFALNVHVTVAAFPVLKGIPKDLDDIRSLQRLELKNSRAGYQSLVYFKVRILRRSSYQNNSAVLYKRKEGILLKLIEPVDLIDEQYGLPALGYDRVLSIFSDSLDICNARSNGIELNKS